MMDPALHDNGSRCMNDDDGVAAVGSDRLDQPITGVPELEICPVEALERKGRDED
jgi:hypothetical protein